MPEDPKYLEAKRHVDALKGFYVHLLVFACVMSGLTGLNFALGPPWWAQWPLIGWGLGVAGHGMLVFSPVHVFSADWEARKIKERMERQ